MCNSIWSTRCPADLRDTPQISLLSLNSSGGGGGVESSECLTFLLDIQVSLHCKAAGSFEVLLCRSDPLHQPLNFCTGTFKVVTSLKNTRKHNNNRVDLLIQCSDSCTLRSMFLFFN